MNLRVLVVDDEPFVAETLRAFLEDEGMQVRIEPSGEAALAAVQSGAAFDACIMDLRLPGMDGDVAAQELHRLCPGLRFLFHTGSTDYVLPAALRAIGIRKSHLFRKPLADMAPLAKALHALHGASTREP
ncbi:MAG TPA: response regulator [bacterium]|jgi:CheY-like chemotaxis protein